MEEKLLSAFMFDDSLKNALCFGPSAASGADLAVKALQGDGGVKIVAKEGDYLHLGKAIRDKVMAMGVRCDGLVCERADTVTPLIDKGDAVVAVGNWQLYRDLILSGVENRIIFVPTDGVFAQVFSPLLPDGEYCRFIKNQGPYKTVVDVETFKGLKRNGLYDGYSFLAAKLGEVLEYKIFCRINGLPYDGAADVAFEKLSALMSGLDVKTAHGIILIGQLAILPALRACDHLGFLDSFNVGLILSKMTGASLYECVNSVIGPLLLAARGYVKVDMGAFLEVEPIFDTERLAELFGIEEHLIAPHIQPYIKGQIDGVKSTLAFFEEELILAGSLSDRMKDGESRVYRGRHRRGEFTPAKIKTAIRLGGPLSKSFLKAMYQEGYCKILEEI